MQYGYRKTRMNPSISYDVDFDILTDDYFVLSQSTRLTDRHTDRRTDRQKGRSKSSL